MQSAALRSHVVRTSVTLVDQVHIDWKSCKLTARTISPTPSLLGAQRSATYSEGNGEIWGRLEVGWKKLAFWSTKEAISLKRVKIEEKLLLGAYRNSSALFRTVPSPTSYGLPFPKIGVRTPPKTPVAIISGTGKAIWTSNLASTFRASIRIKAG